MHHLETNNLLTDRQFAYRKNRCTTTAAYQIYDCVTTALDAKHKAAGVFCDLSKAFDVINHELLLKKIGHYGIKENTQRLLTSFLKDRRQTVEVKMEGKSLKSEAGVLRHGIPQGSSLGNTLFLIFVNDLPSSVAEGTMVLFADDTTVVVTAHTYSQLDEKVAQTCTQLHDWFSANGLILNVSKSNVVLFTTGNTTHVPLVQGPIPRCDSCRFLGFTIDARLKWKEHVDNLCGRLGGAVFALRKLKPIVSCDALLQIYYAYFFSLMSYGIILYGNSTNSDRVFKLQKRALRILAGVNSRHSCRELFKQYKMMTHYSLYVFEVIMFTRRNIHLFKRMNMPGRITRQTGRLLPVSRRLALLDRSPRVIGPSMYERLPANIKNEASNDTFEHRLKELLLSKSLYSVKEYNEQTL
jgi:hypothetical protein